MDEIAIGTLKWDDIPNIVRSNTEWKSLTNSIESINLFMHHFSDLCLCAVSKTGEIRAFMAATINQGLPDTALIQNLSLDSTIVGTGTVKLMLARISAVAKEKGCNRIRIMIPVKSHTFLSLFALAGFTPVAPPNEIKVGKLSQGNIAVKPGSVQDPSLWWKDYFGVQEHGVMLSHDL